LGHRVHYTGIVCCGGYECWQVNSIHLSIPASHGYDSSVILEVRADRSASKLSVEGTLVDGVPQWVAVDCIEFCRPVRLDGHLLICRSATSGSCAPQQCADTLRGTHIYYKYNLRICCTKLF